MSFSTYVFTLKAHHNPIIIQIYTTINFTDEFRNVCVGDAKRVGDVNVSVTAVGVAGWA